MVTRIPVDYQLSFYYANTMLIIRVKKLARLISPLLIFLVFPISVSKVIAQEIITITPPTKGFKTIGGFIDNVLIVLLSIGAIILLFMIVWGAYEWITSGGDKESVSRARGRITAAFIGLAVLAVAFALAKLAATFLGFDITNIIIPTPPP
ncbi:hypothetical protein A3B45_04355 [Candidatus Daviesbacteria bacterium RIFCSPLOWO2_01_FULL_39_12]|uniref:Uncharacterized protein n=1 Tax=Candidatus Daviesbacteria bacterium RIFCSPLOWO2_01_FULL_39_12 TaxID=1797785 RepID=A0A1F5KN91_9BACT|nr:MAG: hypothetical protein A3B45_04355 [Candidatus Daviesbacteria bacterium RIFCSPLOWO2_01_FULL_39_12]